ncbi:M28 family metallopeptidase [Flavonifractor hominis]|uniref:M28 family metallopeptidase n=1 Tax=Flavonifractor hominis TaxID=3133178 RepID=A0ABV1ELU9_9FIRM
MKRTRALTLTLALLLLLPACGAPVGPNALEADLTYLCQEGKGRLTGTEGNDLARDYIAQQFQHSGLSYWDDADDYRVPYIQEVFDSATQNQILTATYSDGTTREFQSGEDFYPYLGRTGFSGEVTVDPSDPALADRVLLTSSFVQTEELPLATVLCQELVTANPSLGASTPQLKVDPALYEALDGCTHLSLSRGLTTYRDLFHNVIGVLPGNDRSQAILLTAHFDHVGSYGDTVYTGAVDNAAGVAALLELVRLLSGDENPPPVDVVFCAFNGEDNGLRGSAALVEAGLPYDQYNVINLDTIGWAGTQVVSLSDNCTPLAEAVQDQLEKAGLTTEIAPSGNSDHNTFYQQGIPAVNVGAAETGEDGSSLGELLHSPADTPDQVDLEKVAAVAAALADYVRTGELVPVTQSSAGSGEDAQALLWSQAEARAQELADTLDLARDEAVCFQTGEACFVARDVSPLVGLEEVAAYDPAICLPEQLGAYTFTALFFGGPSPSPASDRSMSLLRVDSAEGLPLEQPVPLEEVTALQVFSPNSYVCLEYEGPEGRRLLLTLHSPEDDQATGGRDKEYYYYEPADGLEGVWKGYLSPEVYGEERGGDPAELRVEGLSCVITLSFYHWEGDAMRNDMGTESDLNELAVLVEAHQEELAAIQPICW